mmetsp:Transcript_13437/g.26794  ORF Transcript_13437/g.26794 Transcript_13437/m.26794 type:complete len:342 (+) Transcript_13437:913-1938(+)
MESDCLTKSSPDHSLSFPRPTLFFLFISIASFCIRTNSVCVVIYGKLIPLKSERDVKPCFSINADSSAFMPLTMGYPCIMTPEHTWTVSEPNRINSAASFPVLIPPIPDKDLSGYPSAITCAIDATRANAMGLTATELYPPRVLCPSTQGSGLKVSKLMPMIDSIVLIAAIPSLPASKQTLLGILISVIFGVIFDHTGIDAASVTHPVTSASSSQSCPMAIPMRLSGIPCGQLKLISNASTPAASHNPINLTHASLSYSSMIDAINILSGYSLFSRAKSSNITSNGLSLINSIFSHPITSPFPDRSWAYRGVTFFTFAESRLTVLATTPPHPSSKAFFITA